jgi:putative cardiolipin synthase
VLADTAPTQGEFVGLHIKAAVVDRHRVFIGSMNLDPRSQNINSEMGVMIESTSLGADLAEAMEHEMGPENAWRVRLNPAGYIRWEALDKFLTRQPARSFWQRIEDIVFMASPRDLN